jgi:hypothetical protein
MLAITDGTPDLPQWIRIGPPRYKYFYQLMSVEPIIYRGTRGAANPPPEDNECLWLFQRGPTWVAAHAPKNATAADEVLNTTHLVFATNENALAEGDHDWDTVDLNFVLPNGEAVLVGLGSFRTQHVDQPDTVQLRG